MDLCNEKTIFAIDHSPYFGCSSEEPMEMELWKGRNANVVPPLAPITKSLWTCSLEAAIEYCRIVWDLFPEGKLVRLVASDTQDHHFNNWCQSEQNIQYILSGSGTLGPPPRNPKPGDFNVLHGLRAAVDGMMQCTAAQNALKSGEEFREIVNHSRVICITSTRDNDSMRRIQNHYHQYLLSQNKLNATNSALLPVGFCHLVIMNIYPNNSESPVTNQPPTDMSQHLRVEVHSVRAGKLIEKLSSLILGHYDLASTTVNGIPMKEEQNASSSANYDVEIFHHANAHTDMFKADNEDPVIAKTRNTRTLKWCTPRGTCQELYNCTAAYRVTPVDVNSRPSSCLINFLLNGRSVMLESPKRSGGKIISHLLSAHGGEIFIHALATGRSVLEDPPSISEGCGGKVTDYRVADFGTFIKENKLAPLKSRWKDIEKHGLPILKMKSRLERQTKYWPITISGTFIFNLRQYIDPLPQLITKEELSPKDVSACRQVIYGLASLENKLEPLVVPTSGVRGKMAKREEQYKQLWNELERLIRVNCRTEQHNSVLYALHEVRSKDPDSTDKVELDQALRELDVVTSDPAMNRASVIRATTDSPMSPPPMQKASAPVSSSSRQNRLSVNSSIYSGPKTVMDIFMSKVNAENKSIKEARSDFHGRINAGKAIAQLYPELLKEEMERLSRLDDAAMVE